MTAGWNVAINAGCTAQRIDYRNPWIVKSRVARIVARTPGENRADPQFIIARGAEWRVKQRDTIAEQFTVVDECRFYRIDLLIRELRGHVPLGRGQKRRKRFGTR